MKPLRRGQRWTGVLLGAVVLAAVFVSYLDPTLAVDLANRLWACF